MQSPESDTRNSTPPIWSDIVIVAVVYWESRKNCVFNSEHARTNTHIFIRIWYRLANDAFIFGFSSWSSLSFEKWMMCVCVFLYKFQCISFHFYLAIMTERWHTNSTLNTQYKMKKKKKSVRALTWLSYIHLIRLKVNKLQSHSIIILRVTPVHICRCTLLLAARTQIEQEGGHYNKNNEIIWPMRHRMEICT